MRFLEVFIVYLGCIGIVSAQGSHTQSLWVQFLNEEVNFCGRSILTSEASFKGNVLVLSCKFTACLRILCTLLRCGVRQNSCGLILNVSFL